MKRRSASRICRLLRGKRHDIERVDFGLHHLGEHLVDELMPLQRPQAHEPIGDDVQTKVTFPFACAGMTDVAMTVVYELDARVCEMFLDSSANAIGAIACHRRAHAFGDSEESAGTFAAIHRPWPRANRSVNPMTPNNLKFTQMSSAKL